ncbi:MAG: RidA family protein [Thalassobaculaceae bacterium]|nr:RidA family protein [Thalassobaculaceae bacterium]
MTFTPYDPDTVPDLGIPTLTQGLMVAGVTDWFVMSGQIGLKADGTLAGEDGPTQFRQCLENIANLLVAAGLTLDDLVFLRFYLTDPADIGPTREIRNAFLGTRKLPSTLLVISALARPELKVEIEAIAVRR